MKKILIFLILLTTFLTGCSFSTNGKEGEIIAKATALPTPLNVRVYNNYIYWDEVPNANSYIIKINNNQEATGNVLKYSIASIIDDRIDNNETIELHIYVKAKGNQILFTDSEWSEEVVYSYTKVANSQNTEDDKLETPRNVEFTGERIVWDQVENAYSYKIEISSLGTIYSFYSSSNSYALYDNFNENMDFEYRVKAVAENESSYKDSNWSVLQSAKYYANSSGERYNSYYSGKGLGKPVNLLTDSYINVISGVNIFNQSELSKLIVETNKLIKGNIVEFSSETIDEYIDEWNHIIDAKLNISKIKPGEKKIVSQKSLDLNIEYQNGYSIKSLDETTTVFHTLNNVFQYEQYSFSNYKNDSIFKNILSNDFIQDARNLQNNIDENNIKAFLNKYGTHVITSVIIGANLKMQYSFVGTKSTVDEKNHNAGAISVAASKNYWEGSGSLGIDTNSNSFSSNKDININISISFNGGTNQGMGLTNGVDISNLSEFYKKWAPTTNDKDNCVLVDVGDNSLYCIWDLLDDGEFNILKSALNTYFENQSSAHYSRLMEKLSSLYYVEDGTQEHPFIISEADDFSKIESNPRAYFKLNDDIDFDGYNYNPLISFYGTLDGNGYSIKNIKKTINTSGATGVKCGFINENNGTIKNITFTNCTFKVTGKEPRGVYVGVVCGINSNSGTISNVRVINCNVHGDTGTSDSDNTFESMVGGICGVNNGTIEKTGVSNSTIYGFTKTKFQIAYSYVGGITGSNRSKIDCCYVRGNNDNGYYIEAKSGACYSWAWFVESKGIAISNCGGIAGRNEGATITNSLAYRNLIKVTNDSQKNADNRNYGGSLVGCFVSGTINNCYSESSDTLFGDGNPTGAYKINDNQITIGSAKLSSSIWKDTSDGPVIKYDDWKE